MLTGRLLETTKITAMISQRRFDDICTSPQCKYRLFGLKFEKLIWPVLFANIDLNIPFTFLDRTYCDSKGQCDSLWWSHWSYIWWWITSLWTHCRCRDELRVQVTTNISKFIWCQNSTSQIEPNPDKRGLPLDRHFKFYFAGLKANIHTKSRKELLKVFLNKWFTWINT